VRTYSRLPVQIRRRIDRYLQPAREVHLRLQEVRGLRFGLDVPPGPNGTPGNGSPLTPGTANRLEAYFDRHTAGPGIAKWRHYLDIYDRHFSKFVGREVHVVEVGVASGGSLKMWLDYFGAGCRVYGIDIDPACKVHESESIKIEIGDQADPVFWEWFLSGIPRVDILIDDGGHRVRQQVRTFESVIARIEPGGVYLCEDIHHTDNAFHNYICGVARNLHAFSLPATTNLQRLIGAVHLYPFVAVVERPERALMELRPQGHGTEWI
jgi:23S rRNA U2552 (ribose-2'-O)-methylase RlmE/FtsJ